MNDAAIPKQALHSADGVTEARDALNAHPARLHQQHAPSGLTPYQVIGHLTRLRQDGERPTDLELPAAPSWNADGVRQRDDLLTELAQRVADIGRPDDHPWRGVGLEAILPTDVERLKLRLADLQVALGAVQAEAEAIEDSLGRPGLASLGDLELAAALAERFAGAPTILGDAVMIETDTPVPQRLAVLARLTAAQEAGDALEAADALGRTAFDLAWRGSASDWPALRSAAVWVTDNQAPRTMRILVASSTRR